MPNKINNCNNEWQANCPLLNNNLYNIISSVSLTQALQQCNAQFSVQLLYLGEGNIKNDFDDWLNNTQTMWIRDVELRLNNIAVVKARSVCAINSHKWKQILNRGDTPLGKTLFDSKLPIQRCTVEYRHKLPENLVRRRSKFTLNGQHLYLVEHFLPELVNFV